MLTEEVEHIKSEYESEISEIQNSDDLERIRINYVGRNGIIPKLFDQLKSAPKAEKPLLGKSLNILRDNVTKQIKEKQSEFSKGVDTEYKKIDLTLPGKKYNIGSRHILTQTLDEIKSIFKSMGFSVFEGPELESDYYNFEALNFPADHPARDMQDTFFVSENIVLRTHTSPNQIRTMEKQSPPVRIIVPGKVYRCDSDLTHTPMFHQVEGLLVDENISFGDLKGVLTAFVHRMFDEQTSLRFRPSFFPFTEPSAEVDILCVMCRGKGCRVCSQTGWLEILGSGMVHPALYENVGYDADRFTGFAFGMGVDRIAMLKYGIDDIRKFFENDMRFLSQF